MRLLTSIFLILSMLSGPVFAQDDDRGFIAGILENSLAGEGRTVRINGFRGALSRKATVTSIVILDDDGEWLRMENLSLQLNRSALLRGRVEIEELSAETINLSRLPIAPESELPTAEAQGFSLPELPVSVDVKLLRADTITLGETVLGEAATLNLTAALSLIGGEALVKLTAERIDEKRGLFEIDAGFESDDNVVTLNIDLDEGEGGIAARLLGLPGNPSTNLKVSGSGPLSDLTTQIAIATDGQDRLTGTVNLTATEPSTPDAPVSRAFKADVSGDVTALFAPQYRPFFGDDISLKVDGDRSADGALDISNLDLTTQALTLNGKVALNKDFWPTNLDIQGRVGNDAGTLVILPVPGAETKLREANLDVQYDQSQGNTLTGDFQITDLELDGASVARADLQANGVLNGEENTVGSLSALVTAAISGVVFENPDLARAAGEEITGELQVDFVEGVSLKLTGLDVSGTDFSLTGEAEVADLAAGLDTTFTTRLVASDVSRFSGLAGSNLAGSVAIDLSGTADLGGKFDIDLAGDVGDLKIGQEQADALLRGQTALTLKANRDEIGTNIETVSIRNNQLDLTGSGQLTSGESDVTFSTTLNDTSELADILEGPAMVTGTATQRSGEWSVDVDASGPFGASATIDGLVTGPAARVNFDTNLPDIAPFVSGYTGAANVAGEAFVSPDGWNVDVEIDGPYGIVATVDGLVTGPDASVNFDASLEDIAPFASGYSGAATIKGKAFQSPEGWNVDTDATGPYGLTAMVEGLVTGDNASVNFNANLPDIAPFAPGYSGPASFQGRAFQSTEGWNVDTNATGPYGITAAVEGLVTGGTADVNFDANLADIAPFAPGYSGPATVKGRAFQSTEGWNVDTDIDGPYGITADVDGLVTGESPSINFDAKLADIAPFVPGYSGAAIVKGRAFQSTEGWNVDSNIAGPYGITVDVDGLVTGGNASVNFDAKLADIAPFAPGYTGAATVKGRAFQSTEGWNVDTDATGPYGLTAAVNGLVTSEKARVNYSAQLPDVNPLVPQYRGALSVTGTAQNSQQGWSVETDLDGPYGLTANVNGRVTGEAAPDLTFIASLPDLSPIVPRVGGPLDVNGSVKQVSDVRWDINANLAGPAGTTATVTGSTSPSGQLNVDVVGNAPLALANPFLAPNAISGDAQFNLRVNGPPELSSVSGTIGIQDGRAVSPDLPFALEAIQANVGLSNAQANVELSSQISSGGSLRVTGPIGLTGSMVANLQIALEALVLEDPTLYRTVLNGAIALDGPLLSNARISGEINVGETLISVPSSGVSSFGTIPNITHIDPPRAVQATRVRARLIQNDTAKSSGSGGGYPLDITVNAPQQIFVRGRGLDAELGGNLRLTGTTANIVSAGRFELQRGRLDILSKRFELDEGIIQLQGDFDPFLRFVAITDTTVGTASVVIEGLASDPQVTFESTPEAPEDAVLAQIFFGRDVSQISALQALQLASAVATLAGKGGDGVVSKLRRGFALDDLDVTTDDEGNAGLRAGKYISDNIYTDIAVGTDNNAEVSLNIDITPSITATGTFATEGDTSIGIFFKREY